MKTLKSFLHVVASASLALGLAVSATPVSVSKAQGGLTYQSGVQLQNLGAVEANVVLDFIDQTTGVSIGTTSSFTVTAGSSRTFFPITSAPGAPSVTSFNGSLVASSDQPIAAIANLLGNGLAYLDTTSGFSQGGTSFNLPLIMCNNGGFNTFFNVQNTGAVDADVTINFNPGSSGNSATITATIKPGAAKTFDQDPTASAGPNCTTLGTGGATRFVGGASITSSQPVVASVVQLNTTTSPQMIAYDGFASSATAIAVPLLMSQNGGFSTGLQIANTGATTATVAVTFAANTVLNTNIPNVENIQIAAGKSATLLQSGGIGAFSPSNDWVAFGRYVGSATISSDQPIVAITNQSASGKGAAFQARPTASGTGTIKLPLVSANNSGFFTGIQIQNVGAGLCTGTLDFTPNTVVNTNDPTSEPFALAAGASVTFLQNGTISSLTPSNDWVAFGRYVGGATITGSGCSLLAIVNQVGATLDTFSAYNGFNQ